MTRQTSALGGREALDDGSAEAAGAGRAMDEPDRKSSGCRDLADHVGGGIRAVVDEDDLGVDADRRPP